MSMDSTARRSARSIPGVAVFSLCLSLICSGAQAVDGAVTVRGGSGVVRISGPNGLCTGFIISTRIVLTAAHCVTNGTSLTGSNLISIKYTADGVNYFCITSAPDQQGECTSSTFVNWRTSSLPPFNTVEDFAIIYNTQRDWIGITSADAIGLKIIQPQVSDSIDVQGRGGTVASNDNKMRRGTTTITSITTRSFQTVARGVLAGRPPVLKRNGVWMCDGDSGSPAISFAAAAPWVVGIASGISNSGRCATQNADQFFYRIRSSSVNLINYTVNTALPSGTPRCIDMVTFGVMPAGYFWCAGF